MPNTASVRLKKNSPKIMDLWVERALKEVEAAYHQENLALRNSLPDYLEHLSEALSTTVDRTAVRKRADKKESTRIGKRHGKDRAKSSNYSMDQVIFEYHIMRQVIEDVLETEAPLTDTEREVIVCSIEQAVNDAATEYSETLREIQDQLTRTLAHDFRTPLQAAKLNIELILRSPENHETVTSKGSRAIISLDRLNRMIQDLLDASRMTAGNFLKLEKDKNCDLNWIVKEVAAELNISNENGMVIKSIGPCVGNWNESGLRRMVENLAINAFKYGDTHSPVTVTLDQTDEKVKLTVHNQGEPIPKEEVDILFQQYRRSRNEDEKIGWGLGLTVVKGMVDAHKGEIEVISETGKGTSFIITLPKK